MGKKFGTNSKAAEARERKTQQEQEKKQKLAEKKEAEEAKSWSEGAYHNARKESEEAKRLERLARKRERELLEKVEMEQITGKKESSSSNNTTGSYSPGPSSPLLTVYSASNIDDALELMEAATSRPGMDTVEKHPERRMEAAYKRFEEVELPILKQQNPGLRHSQLKERLFRMWKKSPDNPMNQSHMSYRATRPEETAFIQAQNEVKLEQFRLSSSPSPTNSPKKA